MKKLIILSAVSTAVILFSVNLNSSGQNKIPAKGITIVQYQVNIHPGWKVSHQACPMMVEMTNGSGMLTGQFQFYQVGINTYNFYEIGPVSGTRRATLINAGEGLTNDVCWDISLWGSRTGTFLTGEIYTFDLFESAKDRIEPGPPVATQ
jgi:hypothetical protein